MPAKKVDFFYRSTQAGAAARLVGSDHFGPEDMLDASIGFPCPFCGEIAFIDFHRPEGDWPDAVTLVCDAGRGHGLDERQPRREVNEYPLTIGWERCRSCDAVARREVASADATHAEVLCTANPDHNHRDEL